MNPLIILVISAIGIAFFIGYYFSSKAVIKRKLKNSEFKKIADFKNGEVAKIVGTVEFIGPPLHSPFSKRECAHYYIHVEEKVTSGKNSKWETLIEESISSKFLIKENDHYAFINDNKLKSYIVQDVKYSSGFWKDATEDLEDYLKSKGKESEGFLGMNRTIRYKEGVLEKNEKIAVFGSGEWKECRELSLPEKYGKILEIKSSDGEAIYLSDDPDTTLKNTPKIKIEKSVRKESTNKNKRDRYQK